VPSTRRTPRICICAALHLRTAQCSFAFPRPTASASRAIHGSAFLSSPLHELPGSLFVRRQELRCRCSGEDADVVEGEGNSANADTVGTDSTQGRGSAGAFGEERAVVTGEKTTGRVVVAALCRQAVTSRRHAVTWWRRLLASFVASVAQCPFLRHWIWRAAHPDSYRATVFRKTPNQILLIFLIQAQTNKIQTSGPISIRDIFSTWNQAPNGPNQSNRTGPKRFHEVIFIQHLKRLLKESRTETIVRESRSLIKSNGS
jgi:hypothetical protein